MESEFDQWLRTVCFQQPTHEAEDLAKSAWEARESKIKALEDKVERLTVEGQRDYSDMRSMQAKLIAMTHEFNFLKQRLSEAPKCEIRLCDDQIYRITLIDIERNYKFYNKVALVEINKHKGITT